MLQEKLLLSLLVLAGLTLAQLNQPYNTALGTYNMAAGGTVAISGGETPLQVKEFGTDNDFSSLDSLCYISLSGGSQWYQVHMATSVMVETILFIGPKTGFSDNDIVSFFVGDDPTFDPSVTVATPCSSTTWSAGESGGTMPCKMRGSVVTMFKQKPATLLRVCEIAVYSVRDILADCVSSGQSTIQSGSVASNLARRTFHSGTFYTTAAAYKVARTASTDLEAFLWYSFSAPVSVGLVVALGETVALIPPAGMNDLFYSMEDTATATKTKCWPDLQNPGANALGFKVEKECNLFGDKFWIDRIGAGKAAQGMLITQLYLFAPYFDCMTNFTLGAINPIVVAVNSVFVQDLNLLDTVPGSIATVGFCGPESIIVSIDANITLADPFFFSNGVLTISPKSVQNIGVFQLTFNRRMTAGPWVTEVVPITIWVPPCTLATVSYSPTPAFNKEIEVMITNDPTTSFLKMPLNLSATDSYSNGQNLCGLYYGNVYNKINDKLETLKWFTLFDSNWTLIIDTKDLKTVGTYNFRLEVGLKSWPLAYIAKEDFVLKVTAPCQTTSLISLGVPLDDMTLYFETGSASSEEQSFPNLFDKFSLKYDNPEKRYCGDISYKVFDPSGKTVNYVKVLSDSLEVIASSESMGVHTLTLKAWLTDYPSSEHFQELFTVSILAAPGPNFEEEPQMMLDWADSTADFFDLQIPAASNPSGGAVDVSIELDASTTAWLEYDPDLQRISVKENMTKVPGTYKVKCTLKAKGKSTVVYFTLVIGDDGAIQELYEFEASSPPAKNANLQEVMSYFQRLLNPKVKTSKQKQKMLAQEIEWPVPMAIACSPQGEVKIEFSRSVIVQPVENYTDWIQEQNIKHGWLEISILDTYHNVTTVGTKALSYQMPNSARRLRAEDENQQEFEHEFGTQKNFTWMIKTFSESNMVVKLAFTNESQISFRQNDKLLLDFTNPDIFVRDQLTKEALLPKFQVELEVPQQVSSRVQSFVDAATGSAVTFMAIYSIVALLLSFFTEKSLSGLLGAIRSLQLAVHLLIFDVHLYGPLEQFYSGLSAVVMFDIVEMIENFADVQLNIFEYYPTPAFNSGFDNLGYGGTQTFSNLGSIKFLFLYYVGMGLAMRIAIFAGPRIREGKFRNRLLKFSANAQFFKSIIGFTMQIFFDVVISLAIYFARSPEVEETLFEDMHYFGDWLCLVVSILLTALFAAFFGFCIWFFCFKLRKLQQVLHLARLANFKGQVENLYNDIVGARRTKFYKIRVDECDFELESRQMLVARASIATKQFEPEGEAAKRDYFNLWRLVPDNAQPKSILKTSASYRQEKKDFKNLPFERFIARIAFKKLTVHFKDGIASKAIGDVTEVVFTPLPNTVDHQFRSLAYVASQPSLSNVVLDRRHQLVDQGRNKIELGGQPYTYAQLERLASEIQTQRSYRLMHQFYSELNLSRNNAQYFYVNDMARRLAIVLLAVTLNDRTSFQLLVFIGLGLIQTLYVTIVKPFESQQMVTMEVVNEIKLYFVALLILISQSASILDQATKEYKMTVLVGWIIFAVELIVIGVNVVIAIVSAVHDRKRDLKIRRRNKSDALRKADKQAEREKHREAHKLLSTHKEKTWVGGRNPNKLRSKVVEKEPILRGRAKAHASLVAEVFDYTDVTPVKVEENLKQVRGRALLGQPRNMFLGEQTESQSSYPHLSDQDNREINQIDTMFCSPMKKDSTSLTISTKISSFSEKPSTQKASRVGVSDEKLLIPSFEDFLNYKVAKQAPTQPENIVDFETSRGKNFATNGRKHFSEQVESKKPSFGQKKSFKISKKKKIATVLREVRDLESQDKWSD